VLRTRLVVVRSCTLSEGPEAALAQQQPGL